MPRPRIVAPAAASLLVLSVLGAACKEPEAAPEPQRPEVVSVMVDVPDASIEELNDAAEVVRARVMALDLQVGEIGWDDASIEVIVPAADEELVRAALTPSGQAELRPVLQQFDVSTPVSTTPPEQLSPEAEVVLAGLDGASYQLGPSAVGGAGVESAQATRDQDGSWLVAPVLVDGAEGIGAFNELAARCHRADPTCPAADESGRGSVAIVADGAVLSVASVNVPSFERDQIQISADFDERSARALAAALDGGAANVAWTVRD